MGVILTEREQQIWRVYKESDDTTVAAERLGVSRHRVWDVVNRVKSRGIDEWLAVAIPPDGRLRHAIHGLYELSPDEQDRLRRGDLAPLAGVTCRRLKELRGFGERTLRLVMLELEAIDVVMACGCCPGKEGKSSPWPMPVRAAFTVQITEADCRAISCENRQKEMAGRPSVKRFLEDYGEIGLSVLRDKHAHCLKCREID